MFTSVVGFGLRSLNLIISWQQNMQILPQTQSFQAPGAVV